MGKCFLVALYLSVGSLIGCSTSKHEKNSLSGIASDRESILGNDEYKGSPYVTAGNRVYMVGHQDGSFPDLGWHVSGEMGGIWDHPIKLMDGFQVQLIIDGDSSCLDRASSFRNYPFGNEHEYSVAGINVSRFQFVPDDKEGVIVEYNLTNNGLSSQVGFLFTGLVDLQPAWLAERLDIVDSKDDARYNQSNEAIVAKDEQNDWFVAFGADRRPEFHGVGANPCRATNSGNGVRGSLRYNITLESGQIETIRFFIAGSSESVDDTWKTYNEIKQNSDNLLETKIRRYETIAETSLLESGDPGFDRMYKWIKYNTDWLVREVPDIGRGLSAGIPDYPWWFGTDNTYSIQGMLATGFHEDALATTDLIVDISRKVNKSNGKIMHETSTNGEVFNPGNLNTTPYFIHTLWKTYSWTGDQQIIDKYYEDVNRGMLWIEEQDKDGNGYPDGPGMMEIHGLHSEMIDVVVYQALAYDAAANFANIVGDKELSASYRRKGDNLKSRINTDWWVADFNSYADFRANKAQTIELIEAAIVRADTINKPWAISELETTLKRVKAQNQANLNGYVVHHNWVVNTPLEANLADEDKAQKALETARNYRNRFGMYVTGMDRDQSQEKSEKWQAFSYVGAVMTLPTGVQAIAEANYGNANEALSYLKMLEKSFSYALPGSMYEVSPDYGMIAQAWNIYAVAVPVVEHFFGISPMAYDKVINIEPNMPSGWNDVSLSNVKIGDNQLSVHRSEDNDVINYVLTQTKADWTINFKHDGSISLNNNKVLPNDDGVVQISGAHNVIRIEN